MMNERLLLPQFTGRTAQLVERIRQLAAAVNLNLKIEHEDDYDGQGATVVIDDTLYVEPTTKAVERIAFPENKLVEVPAWFIGVGITYAGSRWDPPDFDVKEIAVEVSEWVAAKAIIRLLVDIRLDQAAEYHSEHELAALEARETRETHARVNDARCPMNQGKIYCRCEEFELDAMREASDASRSIDEYDFEADDLNFRAARERQLFPGRFGRGY